MSNIETFIDLWCIVLEGRSVFKITIGADKDLIDLRKVIREAKPNHLLMWVPTN
jgi:hypothetical protein